MKYKGAGIILKEDTAMAPLITRLSIAALMTAALPAFAAQDPAAKPQDLVKGQTVRILLTNGHVVEGQILNITSTALVLRMEKLGTIVQKRSSIEKITDAERGTSLGWQGVEKYEEEIRQRNTPPPTETTPPVTTTPPDTVVLDKPAEAEALQKLLQAWGEKGFGEIDALRKDLASHGTSASAYLIQHIHHIDSGFLPAAGRALADLNETGTVEKLLPLLKAPRDPVRLAVTGALVILSPATPDPYLQALEDSNADVRLTALASAVRFNETPRAQHIAPLVMDLDKRVRVSAGNYLSEWAKKQSLQWQAADWVSDALARQTNVAARIHGLDFLGRVPSAEAAAAMRTRWASPDPAERIAVARAAGSLDIPEGKELLLELLDAAPEDGEPDLVKALAASAISLKDRASIGPMIKFLANTDESAKADMHHALQTVSKVKLPPDPEKWEEWLEKNPAPEENP